MTRRHPLLLSSAVAGALGLVLAATACGDSDQRPNFEPPPDAGHDGNVVDSGAPEDAAADARPPFEPADQPVTCAVEPCAVELAAGASHVCARMSDGTARCWGEGMMGELGAGEADGGEIPGPGPLTVLGLEDVTQISAAGRTTCARLADGKALCWGANEEGQLGLAVDPPNVDDLPHYAPEPVDVTGSVTRVDVGPRTVCALLASGDVWCWGANERLQLGRTTDERVAGPGLLPAGGLPATRIGLGRHSSFALTGLGALVGWGKVSGREGSLDPDPVPFALPGLTDVTGIATGPDHTCAIAGAVVHCWGRNHQGALCSGLPDDSRLPLPTSTVGSAYPQRLAVSYGNTCVRMTDGSIQCCGDDSAGQLGTGTISGSTARFTAASVFEHEAIQVVVTDRATCALVRDGSVECWGSNSRGELGQRTRDDAVHLTPLRVDF